MAHGLRDGRPEAARSGACACRSGPRRAIFLADLAWLTRLRRWLPAFHSRASLRTRGVWAWPAWKVASTWLLSARRRGWVPGAHTDASGIDPRPAFRLPTKAILGWLARSGRATSCAARNTLCSRNGAHQLPRTETLQSSRTVPLCLPRPHTRRRADRSPGLANFHAGQARTPRLRGGAGARSRGLNDSPDHPGLWRKTFFGWTRGGQRSSWSSLPGLPSHSAASGSGSLRVVMTGQIAESSALSAMKPSCPAGTSSSG